MSATGFLVRHELRRRRLTVALLAGLVALVTGVVLTASAGARRSESAPERFVDALNPVDFFVERTSSEPFAARAEEVPGVAAAEDMTVFAAYPEAAAEDDYYPMVAPEGTLVPERYHRGVLLRGERADPTAPHEVTLGERPGSSLGVDVGDTLHLVSLVPGQQYGDEPAGPDIDLSVVGITRDLEDATEQDARPALTILTPAFHERYLDEITADAHVAVVALEPDADPRAVTDALHRIDDDVRISRDDTEAYLASSLHPSARAAAIGLAIVALVALVAGAVAIGQVSARVAQRSAAQSSVLAAIGVERRALWAGIATPGLLAVLLGVPLGAVASVLASPLHPIGQARHAETDPGVALDATVLLVGGALLLLGLGGLVAWNAHRASRPSVADRPIRASMLAGSATTVGFPPSVVTGLSMALRPRSSAGGAPSRPAAVAVAAGVTGLVAAVVFSSSLDRLTDDPRLYGVPWDARVEGDGTAHLAASAEGRIAALEAMPGVDAVTEVFFQISLTVDGLPVSAQSVTEPGVDFEHQVLTGRAPTGDAEVALGRRTLSVIGHSVGDVVDISIDGAPVGYRIVGEVIVPSSTDGSAIAEGAILTPAGLDRLGFGGCRTDPSCYRNAALRLEPGADLDALRAELGADINLILASPPAEVARVAQIDRLPWVVGAILAVLAITAVTYAVTSLVRRQRRELAVLRCVGFTRRQVRTTVMTQVVVLVVSGAVVGVVLGLIVGRQLWGLVADAISVAPVPSVPLLPIVAVLAVTAVLAGAAAVPSRRSAGRLRPAAILRTE